VNAVTRGRPMSQVFPQLDVQFVEQQADVRIIVSIPGRYALANRRDAQGNRREFACRAVNLSARAVTLAAPVKGALGERVIANIERVGKLEGVITRLLDRGFVMSIGLTDEERSKLAVKLDWLEKNKNHDLLESRKTQRITPRTPHSTLVLADGTVLQCLVIDMSTSGAAVSADLVPDIGMPLAVGVVVGRVVRRFAEGFSVQFMEELNPDLLEEQIIRP
jgi:PilZ domain-containing protein